jgi:hypothetical protein
MVEQMILVRRRYHSWIHSIPLRNRPINGPLLQIQSQDISAQYLEVKHVPMCIVDQMTVGG